MLNLSKMFKEVNTNMVRKANEYVISTLSEAFDKILMNDGWRGRYSR